MKYKNLIKIFLLIITTFCFLCLLSACKKSKTKDLISFSFKNEIKNLDPQTASTNEEIIIIENIFEGLYKKGKNNDYVLGVAEKVDLSNDKKTYIFTIKNNAIWRNNKQKQNEKVTATDFLFAFRRLLNRNSTSPFARNYYFIKNAKEVKEGKMPIENLGVNVNNKNQLLITVNYKPPAFEELLASSAAMPCNEKFFNSTKGRYGISKENILSNGPFFLNSWNEEQKKYKIRKNDKYYNFNDIKIIGVNFAVRSDEEILKLIQKQEINTALINSSQFNSLNSHKKFKNISFQNSVTGIVFNKNSTTFNDEQMIRALATSVNRTKLEQTNFNNSFIANSIIPNSVKVGTKRYNENKPEASCCPNYDPIEAKKCFDKAIAKIRSKNKNFDVNNISILVNNSNSAMLNQLLQTWQKDLKLFLKRDINQEENYYEKLKSKNFSCAVITLKNKLNSPASILNNFLKDSSSNYMNYDIKNYNELLNKAEQAENINDAINLYYEAEKLICMQGYFIPLYFKTEYFLYNDNIKDILFNPSDSKIYYAYASVS